LNILLTSILNYLVIPAGQLPAVFPDSQWDGTAGTGFGGGNEPVPSDPTRTTAKPVIRMLVPPRQTVTDELVIGVFAAANNGGSLLTNLGLEKVTFHVEGTAVDVNTPTFQTFTRSDATTYELLGWWVKLDRGSLTTEGVANVYVEAVPADTSMQNRVIGPYPFLLYNDEFDATLTVGSGETFTTLSDAWNNIRSNGYQRPLVEITDGTLTDPGNAIGQYIPEGWITIRATTPVTLKQDPPALTFDFTRISTRIGRMKFTGSNITIDFVETNQFNTEGSAGYLHWFDGINIVQSRGRDDLWRGTARNIIPSLIEEGAYFTECSIQDVNDWGDKTPLARGNITNSTWADALQDSLCAVANIIEDHSSSDYYQNIDALTITYTGANANPRVSFSGSNMGNNRVFTLSADSAADLTFTVFNTEAAYRNDKNYTVQNVVDWINGQTDWNATLVDNTRFAAAISEPGTQNGSRFTDLPVGAGITLVTHFDIHSDLYQLPNLNAPRENVVFAFNEGFQIDAQDLFITGNDEAHDFMFICNAFHNNLGTADEGLLSQMDHIHSHVVVAHNSLATQDIKFRGDQDYDGDSYCTYSNNVCRDLNEIDGALDPDITVDSNHIWSESVSGPAAATNTTVGGDSTNLFVDAQNGDFTPAGALLTNTATPLLPSDQKGTAFPNPTEKGAIA